MSISTAVWTPCSKDKLIHAFLKAEDDRVTKAIGRSLATHQLITHPDFANPAENNQRLSVLVRMRGGILQDIPPTQWYESVLNETDIPRLLVIANCGAPWSSWSSNHSLEAVAASLPSALTNEYALRAAPSSWVTPILWAHSKDGPYLILEGNHRFIAYAASNPRLPFNIPVYVGLSTFPSIWHENDNAYFTQLQATGQMRPLYPQDL